MFNGIPNWLCRHPDGEYLIHKCITETNFHFDRIIIPILREFDEKYDAKHKLKKILKDISPIPEILVINDNTDGPADTIYKTIIESEISGSITVHDSDVFLKTNIEYGDNIVIGLNLQNFKRNIKDISDKSFVKVNENGIILDIIEKEIVSDCICCGIYGFKNADDFCKAYELLSQPHYKINNLYVSNIISYLIGIKNYVFLFNTVEDYCPIDNLVDWKRLNMRYGTYFIDCENISTESIEKIKKICEKGAKVIVFYDKKTDIYKNIQNYNFSGLTIVAKKRFGDTILINNEEELNEYISWIEYDER